MGEISYMPREISAGAVIFRKSGGKTFFLLLHYSLGHWDFPKGHIEPGEDERTTVLREVQEETGITDVSFVDEFRETIKYYFRWKGKGIFKIVVFYLLRTSQEAVKLSFEHIGYEWLLHEDAMKRMKFKNGREILEKAMALITEKEL